MVQKKSTAGRGPASPKRRTHGYRGYGSGFARGTDQYGGNVHWGSGFAGVGTLQPPPELIHRGFSGISPRGYVRPDERIREEICDELTRRADIDPRRIDVRVVDGEVVIEGEVEDAATKSAVEDIAARCGGVTAVVNRLFIDEDEALAAKRPTKKDPGAC